MKYLVTGGAGFIGSHIATALVERGDQVRVLDNLCTGTKQNLAHLGGQGRVHRGRRARPAAGGTRGRGVRRRVPPGGARVGAAKPQGAARDARGVCDRHGQRARCGAARRRAARRVRGLEQRVRRSAVHVEARERPAGAAVALRGGEARGRALLPVVHRQLRTRDGGDPLLQRVRPAAGSQRRVLGGDSEVRRARCSPAGGRRFSATGCSRATSRMSRTWCRATSRRPSGRRRRGACSTSPAAGSTTCSS